MKKKEKKKRQCKPLLQIGLGKSERWKREREELNWTKRTERTEGRGFREEKRGTPQHLKYQLKSDAGEREGSKKRG